MIAVPRCSRQSASIGVAERTGHDVAAVGPAEHVEQSLPTVGEGDLVAVVAELPARMADRGGDVGGRRGAPELVDRGHDPHVVRP